jgi:hypothetical protein
MKKSLVLLIISFIITNYSFAQIDKAEKKRIKKELKEYKKNPQQYKSMIEGYKNNIKEAEETIEVKKQEITDCESQKKALKNSLSEMSIKFEEVLKKLANCEAKVPGQLPTAGTFYKVQFGLYEHFDLTDYFTVPKFIGSEKVDKYNAYVVSYFDSEEQAQAFKLDMQKMGLRDAFVSKYIDGSRIYEWEKNPKFKGKPTPASLQEGLGK